MIIDSDNSCYNSIEIYIDDNGTPVTVWNSNHKKYSEIDLKEIISNNLEGFVNMTSTEYDNVSKVYDWYLLDEDNNAVNVDVIFTVDDNYVFELKIMEAIRRC